MAGGSHRKLLGRRLRFTSFIVVWVLSAYVASFFSVRQWLNVTPHPVHPATGEPIAWYYFSTDPTYNEVLFYLFYPIHHWTLGGYTASTLEAQGATDVSLEPGRPIYIDRSAHWPFSPR